MLPLVKVVVFLQEESAELVEVSGSYCSVSLGFSLAHYPDNGLFHGTFCRPFRNRDKYHFMLTVEASTGRGRVGQLRLH